MILEILADKLCGFIRGYSGDKLKEGILEILKSKLEFEDLEDCCQVHEEIRIIYTVDKYLVILSTQDGERKREVWQESGRSILDALINLNRTL